MCRAWQGLVKVAWSGDAAIRCGPGAGGGDWRGGPWGERVLGGLGGGRRWRIGWDGAGGGCLWPGGARAPARVEMQAVCGVSGTVAGEEGQPGRQWR